MNNRDERIEMYTVISLIILVLFSIILIAITCAVNAQADSFRPGELACFKKVDARDFVAPKVEPRFRAIKGLRRCLNAKNQFKCALKDRRVRPSRNVLQVVYDPRVKVSKSDFGGLGWNRTNLATLNDDRQIPNALLIARGVDSDEIGLPEEEEFSLLVHSLMVAEIKCVSKTRFCKLLLSRDGKECETSFGEVQVVPGFKE